MFFFILLRVACAIFRSFVKFPRNFFLRISFYFPFPPTFWSVRGGNEKYVWLFKKIRVAACSRDWCSHESNLIFTFVLLHPKIPPPNVFFKHNHFFLWLLFSVGIISPAARPAFRAPGQRPCPSGRRRSTDLCTDFFFKYFFSRFGKWVGEMAEGTNGWGMF